MLEIWLEKIVLDVIAILMGTALIRTWAFRGKIWPKVASLYMWTSEAVTVPIALYVEIVQNLAQLTNDISGAGFSAGFKFSSLGKSSYFGGRTCGDDDRPSRPHGKDQ